MTWLPGKVRRFTGKTGAPGSGDDVNDGYEVSDIWVDETNDNSYQCQDVTAGAAVWAQIDLGGGVGSGSMTTVKEGGVQLGGADIVTLDFDGDDFDLTETPDTEVNIVVNPGGHRLDDHGAAEDNTDNDATTSIHGLLPKGDNDPHHFMKADIGWDEATICFDARKGSPGTITLMKAVYADDWNPSGFIEVELADADDASKMPCIGLVAESSIGVGSDGHIMASGVLTGLNTSGFADGDVLYVDTTAGGLTATRPTGATAEVQRIGVVLRAHNGSGAILVLGAGRSNDVPNVIELGHASDTTLARVSAGVVSIEGTTIAMVGDAPTAHQGSHTDGNDDIQSATNAQKGVATAAHITAIEANTLASHSNATDHASGSDDQVAGDFAHNSLADLNDGDNYEHLTAAQVTALHTAGTDPNDHVAGTDPNDHAQDTDTGLGGVSTKDPPIDADKALYRDSTAGDALVTSTWTQIKAFLKTYFDGIYGTMDDLVDDTAPTLGGNLVVGENYVQYDSALSADGTFSGNVKAGVIGYASAAFGELVYLDFADGRWELADADSEDMAGDVELGVVISSGGSDGNACVLLHWGYIREDDWNWTSPGKALYVGIGAGAMQTAQPTGNTDIVRVVGYQQPDTNTILFDPSKSWVEVSV